MTRVIAIRPQALPTGSCLVVGFLGGIDRWDDERQGVRQVALRLRERGFCVETFENRRCGAAYNFVNETLRLSSENAEHLTVVIYGQSLGGAAAVRLARRLQKLDATIQLTILVDSIGVASSVIPRNVRYAANFYQNAGLIVAGTRSLSAADSAQTTILGNWRWRASLTDGGAAALKEEPWWKTFFQYEHLKMMHDETLWDEVGNLIITACNGDDLQAAASRISAKCKHVTSPS